MTSNAILLKDKSVILTQGVCNSHLHQFLSCGAEEAARARSGAGHMAARLGALSLAEEMWLIKRVSASFLQEWDVHQTLNQLLKVPLLPCWLLLLREGSPSLRL